MNKFYAITWCKKIWENVGAKDELGRSIISLKWYEKKSQKEHQKDEEYNKYRGPKNFFTNEKMNLSKIILISTKVQENFNKSWKNGN